MEATWTPVAMQQSHGKQPTSLDLEGRESSVALADFKRRTHAAPLDQLDCTHFCHFSRTKTPSPGDFDHRGRMMHQKMQSPGPAIALVRDRPQLSLLLIKGAGPHHGNVPTCLNILYFSWSSQNLPPLLCLSVPPHMVH